MESSKNRIEQTPDWVVLEPSLLQRHFDELIDRRIEALPAQADYGWRAEFDEQYAIPPHCRGEVYHHANQLTLIAEYQTRQLELANLELIYLSKPEFKAFVVNRHGDDGSHQARVWFTRPKHGHGAEKSYQAAPTNGQLNPDSVWFSNLLSPNETKELKRGLLAPERHRVALDKLITLSPRQQYEIDRQYVRSLVGATIDLTEKPQLTTTEPQLATGWLTRLKKLIKT